MENKPAIILNQGEGKEIRVGDSSIIVKLASQNTGNNFSITEYSLPGKIPGPPPHKHKEFEHAWYVLEGELNIELNNTPIVLKTGAFVFIPKRTVHAFSNKSDFIVKVVVFDSPGGFEQYYEDIQEAFADGKPLDPDTFRNIQFRYDTYPPDFEFDDNTRIQVP